MKSIPYAIAVAALAGTLGAASAQTTNIILQTDFDGDAGEGNFTGTYAWVWAGTDAGSPLNVTVNSSGVMPGVGVDGSSAFESSPDYTDLATDPGWLDASAWASAQLGCGVNFSAPITPLTPTSVLSSLILNADVEVSDVVSGQWGANVLISKLQFIDNTGKVVFDWSGYGVWAGMSGFTHLTVPVSDLAYASDASNPMTDFTNAAVVSSITSFTVEFMVDQLVGDLGGTGSDQLMPIFGFSNTGTLLVDNVELVQTGNTNAVPPTPTVENPIWQANFQTTFPDGYEYGFSDRDGSPAAVGNWSINPTNGVDGSPSLEYTVDFSSWSNSPPVSYSGFGLGANENPIPYTLTSSSKASYRVYLSAKVGGTAPSVTNVSGTVDLSFFIPSGTEVYDLTSPLVLSTNWQSYVFDGGTTMQVATWLVGAQQLFDQNVTNVNQMEVQVAVQGSPDVGLLFDYATNATVDLANVQVMELIPGLAPITMVQTNGHSQVLWTDPASGGTAQLQSATNVAGPYFNIAGASSATASPYTVPSGSQQQFFRTVWVP